VYNSNPGAVAPNQNAVRRGMARTDLFTVVHELFFTDTTDYADYILPATTFLEHTDIQGAYGTILCSFRSRPLSRRVRRGRTCGCLANWHSAWLYRDMLPRHRRAVDPAGAGGGAGWRSTMAGMEHISVEDLEELGHIPLAIHREGFQPFSSGEVATPSARIEFYSARLAAQDLDSSSGFCAGGGVQVWHAGGALPAGVSEPQGRQLHELDLRQPERHRKMEARTSQRLEMHPVDAESRGIGDGDAVRVWNERGSLRLTALVNGAVPAGWWRHGWTGPSCTQRGQRECFDQRTADRSGRGGNILFTLVEVERA